MITVFITVRDLLDTTRELARQVTNLGARPVLVDNASTYPPLLAWYEECVHQVIRLERNYGQRATWDAPAVLSPENLDREDCYVVTDCDLDISQVPLDVLNVLKTVLDEWPDVQKAGLSLELSDIPDAHPDKKFIHNSEDKYWSKVFSTITSAPYGVEKSCDIYDAEIETTFAMYRKSERWRGYQAVRLGRPYTARHVPWYWDWANLPPDAKHYLENARLCWTAHSARIKETK